MISQIFCKFARPATLSIAFILAAITTITPTAQAAPGYTYDAIYVNGQFPLEGLSAYGGRRVAINNRGDIVFSTEQKSGFNPRTNRVYFVGRGQAPQLIYEAVDVVRPIPRINSTTIGINDEGIVAVPLIWTQFDANENVIAVDTGYGLFEPGIGLIREIRQLEYSSGRPNASLQMAGFAFSPTRLVITDGISSESTETGSIVFQGGAVVNNTGTAASSGTTASNQLAVLQAGIALNFSTVTPDPVRTFRISGIEQPENLDPDDVTAFVTGLTFAVNTDEDVSYTMVPVVVPADSDSDGVPDDFDDFPLDPGISGDPDADGIDSNTDTDDDGDGVADNLDDYPWGRFTDAGPQAFAFRFIEALARSGITAGCGNGKYCPTATVSRDQMAVFLLRSKHGSSYVPPPATGVFSDVPSGSFASGWIEQLAAERITAGCGNGKFCPKAAVTRAQMAVFLVRTFGL